MPPRKRYRCRFCGVSFAALPVTQAPNGAMLLHHLGADHLAAAKPYLQRMETECIDTVVMELFERVKAP